MPAYAYAYAYRNFIILMRLRLSERKVKRAQIICMRLLSSEEAPSWTPFEKLTESYTVQNPSWKFRNTVYSWRREPCSIFLIFSILSYWFLNIHLYKAFGSELPQTFFYSVYVVIKDVASILSYCKTTFSVVQNALYALFYVIE
jgi:hypothetical protein